MSTSQQIIESSATPPEKRDVHPGRKAWRAAAVAAVVAATAGTTAGCSGNAGMSHVAGSSVSPVPKGTGTASNGRSPEVPPSPNPTSGYTVSTAAISSAARRTLGQGAQDGTDAAIVFAESVFYDDHCFVTPAGTDVDQCVRDSGQAMTSSTKSDWNRSISGFISDAANDNYGKSQDSSDVLSLTFYGGLVDTKTLDDGKEVAAAPDGAVFVNKQISQVVSLLNNDGRLLVRVKASAQARVIVDEKLNLWTLKRHCNFYMKRVHGAWKIDGWQGGYDTGKFVTQ